MSFRLADSKRVFLIVLMLSLCALAQAQSAGSGQPILFTTPQGQVLSNSAVPVAEAPEAEEPADLPAMAPVTFFHAPLPQAPLLPAPAPVIAPQGRNADPMDIMDPHKALRVMTPAQIMGVESPRQIFGLPDSNQKDKDPFATDTGENGGNTNIIYSGDSSSDDPTWAKFLAENGDEHATASGKTGKSHGFLDGFFNGSPGDSLFGNPDKNAADGFGPSQADQTVAGQSAFDSSLAGANSESSTLPPPAPEPAPSSGLNQPSPYALPQSSSLATLPQLPSPPSLPGQNFNSPPPTPPSWQPKPAPWLSTVPQPGTMPQRKF